jgi:RHS repeat-associated protein
VDNQVTASSETKYAYDGNGNLAQVTLPNSTSVTYGYDNTNHVTTINNAVANMGYTYGIGSGWERTRVDESNHKYRVYGYDNLYRLTSEARLHEEPERYYGCDHAGCGYKTRWNSVYDNVFTYTYDAVGNRQTRSSDSTALPPQDFTGLYDNRDRCTADGYAWDANGNDTQVNGKTATYDAENRLISLKGDGVDVAYTYDPDGNRISKTDNIAQTTTQYLVDTNNLTGYAQVVEELDAANTVQVVYTYGLDLISQNRHRIASYWNKSYYGYDGTGSVRYLMDGTGTVTDTYTYDAFGTMLEKTGTTTNAYLFQGEQFDDTLGLYYLRARYMDSNVGRFATMDSFDGDEREPLTLNKYVSFNSDPVDKYDPAGQMAMPKYCSGIFKLIFEHIFGVRGRFEGDFRKCLSQWSSEIYIPPGVDIDANVITAFDMGEPSWINHVRPEGVWDYKFQFGTYTTWAQGLQTGVPKPGVYQKLANLANFNFGATGKALRPLGIENYSLDDDFLLFGAGVAEYSKRENKYGTPWSSPTYGDRPEDQEWIQRGIEYYKEHYHEEN